MVSSANFLTAINVLERLTSVSVAVSQPIQFSEEYNGQHPISTALKILHKAALEGTSLQKTQLSNSRHKIIALNTLLRSASLSTEVSDKFGIDMGEEAARIKGMQVALPQTKFEKMLEIATKIPRIIFTILIDVLLLPGALVLLLVACCKPDFNPKPEEVKYGKTPILLLHGSGFNQSEWVVGRQFLKKKQYGSIFSLNYDGLVSNEF